MDKDEIIRMATEVWGYSEWKGAPLERLERFFNLAFEAGAAHERQKFMAVCEAEYKKYDELVTEEDVGHEEATAIIHLMRKLEGMK